MSCVIKLSKSVEKGRPVSLEPSGFFIKDFGVEGDRHGGKNLRQVSFFGIESIQKMEQLHLSGLCTKRFNENVITENIELYKLPIGTLLKIGETIQKITQVGKKCFGCEISDNKEICSLANEVVFTAVIKSGVIKIGDSIEILDP
ncbi:MOSC domain-containing protein [Acetobacterium wieringae]|uniref:MOSC domain-containing protein n=1 Tax=Acetobacterium wieringae TaxID=52694 RepID=UPI0026EB6800|nr:MOSC domain-containing protein [Acetobacterium wieringae]